MIFVRPACCAACCATACTFTTGGTVPDEVPPFRERVGDCLGVRQQGFEELLNLQLEIIHFIQQVIDCVGAEVCPVL